MLPALFLYFFLLCGTPVVLLSSGSARGITPSVKESAGARRARTPRCLLPSARSGSELGFSEALRNSPPGRFFPPRICWKTFAPLGWRRRRPRSEVRRPPSARRAGPSPTRINVLRRRSGSGSVVGRRRIARVGSGDDRRSATNRLRHTRVSHAPSKRSAEKDSRKGRVVRCIRPVPLRLAGTSVDKKSARGPRVGACRFVGVDGVEECAHELVCRLPSGGWVLNRRVLVTVAAVLIG